MANQQLDRLKSQLLTSGMAQKNNALFQVIDQLIDAVRTATDLASNITVPSAASPNATYLTENDETTILPNSRQELAGAGISFDDTVAGQRTVDSTIPDVSAAVVLTDGDETATFPNSRDLLAGVGVSFDDTVANQRTVSIASGSGFLTGTVNPQGVQIAGIGTWYIDTVTGYAYRKIGGAGTAYGWFLQPPPSGVGGPQPFVAYISGVTSAVGGTRTSGYGYFMPGVADGVDMLTATGVTTLTNTYVSGKLFKSISSSGAGSPVNTYYTSNTTNLRQSLDDDFDLWIEYRTGPNISDIRHWFGLSASAISDSDTFGVGSNGALLFRYSTPAGDGGWIGQSCKNGAANHSETATVATIAVDTTYILRIRFVRSGTPTVYFSVNHGTELSLTTNIPPTGSGYFLVFGLTQKANAVKTFLIRSIGGMQGS